jgi:hypothetical protein
VVRPYVEHIHDRQDLARKEGWDAAGILNLARTGHMPLGQALHQYSGKLMLATMGAVKYTITMGSPANFLEYVRFIGSIIGAPRRLLRTVPRMPREAPPPHHDLGEMHGMTRLETMRGRQL